MKPGVASRGVELETWNELLRAGRAEIAEAIENTTEHTRTLHSYDAVATEAIQELVTRQYETVLDTLDERRRPDARTARSFFERRGPDAPADASFSDAAGETRAGKGVAIREMLALWRVGLEYLRELARRDA